ncbi:MAG: DUF5615 family PIN-like protein [Nitrososphaera sp.]
MIDANVGFVAKHMRQLGYNAESVLEINRRKKLRPKLHRDEQILNYAIENDAVLITADKMFRNRCVNLGQRVIFVELHDGRVYSKLEHMMILQSQLDPSFFQNWLAMGRPHWATYLKEGDGNWNEIEKNKRYEQRYIDQIMNFDPLGYPKSTHVDRQARIPNAKSVKRHAWRNKINKLVAMQKAKSRMKARLAP